MSIVVGIIRNNKVIISTDTKLVEIANPQNYKEGFPKIYQFTLDNNKYIIGCAGEGKDIAIFLKTLSQYQFKLSMPYKQSDFILELRKIFEDNHIHNAQLIIGCIDNNKPKLFMINANSIESADNDCGYFILPPANLPISDLNAILETITLNESNELDFLKNLQLKVGEKTNFKYVNDDFYYNILDCNNEIIKPAKSDKGFEMP